jgi:hypothetical protein
MADQIRTNKRTGEVQAMQNGVWVTVKPATSEGPAFSVTKPGDPTLPYKATEARNSAAASEFAPIIQAGEAQKTPFEVEQARLQNDNIRLQMELDRRRSEREDKKANEDKGKPDPQADARRALQDQLDRVSLLYGNDIKGGAPNPIWGRIPFSEGNDAFNTAAQGLANPFMAAFRTPGAGSQSDTELKQFMAANTPEASDTDATITEKIRNIQTRLGGDKMDASTALVAGPGGGERPALAQGVRDEVDPILKGVAARVGSMIANPATTDAQILDFLKKNGVDPANTSIAEPLNYRKTQGFKAWQRKNPGAPYPVGPNFYTKQVPLSPVQNLGNTAAQSGVGAFAIGAAQGVSGNRLDNFANLMGGDGEAINTATQLSRANNPGASFAGDVSGQAISQYLLGRVPGMGWTQKSGIGRLGDDAAYGAYAGSGDEDVGALTGALTNATGGAFGRGAAKLGKGALTGLNNPSLSYLNDAGVPLTIGQMGRGSGGKLGDTIGGIEDRAAGLPVFDAIINSARQRGDEGFNRAAFREMGGSGATGAAGVIEGQGLVSDAYRFLDNTNLPVDAQFAGSQAAVRAGLPSLPGFGREVGAGMDAIDMSARGGSLPGREWQGAVSNTRADRSSIAGQPFARPATGALNEVEDNLMGLAERQGPAGTIDNLTAANRLNGQFQTLAAALDNGPAQARGELFSPSRLDTASRAGARNFGGRSRSMQGNRPFYSLSKAGMEVMPNLTPDSGTAGRSLFYSALPGLIGGGGIGLAAGDGEMQGGAEGASIGAASTVLPTLALMALYSKKGQKGIQKAMLGKRPDVFGQISDRLNSGNMLGKAGRSLLSSRTAGNLGSASLRDLLLYPELDPNNP